MALKILVERRHALKFILSKSIIGILYPMGEPILPHLLRYSTFVVDDPVNFQSFHVDLGT
ncbi:MAG: hypothetical protein U9Q97_02105 [Acidobacteriota bacterium]|nr:hypothetical protein [Acidobacteriota bacterium]